jgi:diaminopimelate decarboxylase
MTTLPASQAAPPSAALAAEALRDAAARWGSPLYVTDLDVAAARLAAYHSAFPDALVAYAVKANPDSHLLRRLAAEGAGAEVVNRVELALALRAGFRGPQIVMNGVGKTDADHAAAMEAGALLVAESLEELDAILARGEEHLWRLGLRLNPGLAADTHPHLATGAAESKFGIGWPDLDTAIDRCRAAGRPIESVGAHIGSAIDDLDAYTQLAKRLAEAAGRAEARTIDLGGGAGTDLTPAALAEATRPHLQAGTSLILEPGRSLVAEAGWLVTRVVRVQPRPAADLTYLVGDAGMAELIRPALYGAEHPLALLEPGEPLPEAAGAIHLAGPVCEAGDIVAHDIGRWLPPDQLRLTGTGALLVIGQAGAYGAAMASVYNGRPRPAEAVIERGAIKLSRHRETVDGLIARDADVYDRAPEAIAERIREGMTMALYLSLSLLAVMVAFEDPTHPDMTDSAQLVFLTAIGLMLAHLLAFRMSSRLVARGERTSEYIGLVAAQVAGGAVVTAIATVPLLLFGSWPGLLVSEVALLALIAGVGYVTGRAAGYTRLRALLYVLGVVALTVVVLWVKGLAH